MKKVLFIIAAVIIAFTASAQVEKGFRMGVQVNAGLSNVTGFDGDKFAFNYGANFIAEYNFSESTFLSSGLGLGNFAHKEDGIDGSINAFTLTLPIHIGYRVNLSETSHFFVHVGPQLAYGIFGSDILSGGYKINWFDIADRFDLGLGGRLGVEFNKIQISAGVNYGLLEVTDMGGHNLNFNIGVGYMF